MAEIITEKELQLQMDVLVAKFNCPTEFEDNPALQKFMAAYQSGDTVQLFIVFDDVFGRITVALKLMRKDVVVLILEKGKPVGE